MALLVVKFGGSSVASIKKIKNIAKQVTAMRQEGSQVVVVVSAMGNTTDELIALSTATGKQQWHREMDALLATGEQQSAALLAMSLNSMGTKAISLTGWQAGISSDSTYSKARIISIAAERIWQELREEKVVVIAGFQGLSPQGDITTLGRGGSDTTAVALAAALGAECCIIFTDVDGIYTADPRMVPNAHKMPSISYEEMLELASLGAMVMQPRAVECAMQYHVKVEVRNSLNNGPGTIITEAKNMEKQRIVSGVAHDVDVARIAIFDVPDRPGVASLLFKQLAREGINVDMVIQSAMRENRNDIAFTIEKADLHKALPVVEDVVRELQASGLSYDADVAKVSIVGAGMITNPGVAADMFEALAEKDINIHMISTSEIKVSCLIDEALITEAVQALHAKYDLGNGNGGRKQS